MINNKMIDNKTTIKGIKEVISHKNDLVYENKTKFSTNNIKTKNKNQKYILLDNIKYNLFESFKNVENIDLTKIQSYFYIKSLNKLLKDKIITKAYYKSKIRQRAKYLNALNILNNSYDLETNKTLLNLCYNAKPKKITKKDKDKVIYLLENRQFELKCKNKGYIILNTVLGGSLIKNKAYILKNKNEYSLISWNNKILKVKTKNNCYELFISTHNELYSNNKLKKYDLTFNKDFEVDFTLLLSKSTLQHIKQFISLNPYFKEFKEYKPLEFLKYITTGLNPSNFDSYKKDIRKNKMIKIGEFDKNKNKWIIL